MDNCVSHTYLSHMFARVIAMLAIFTIVVVATVTSGHAARMSAVPDHAVHVTEMMRAPHGGEASCDGDRHCGSAAAGMCEFICTGLSVSLPSPVGDADYCCTTISHDRPLEKIHAGLSPGLNERPPKPRLF